MLKQIYYLLRWIITGEKSFDYTLRLGHHRDPRCFAFTSGQAALEAISAEILINTNMSENNRNKFEKYAEVIITHESIHMALLEIDEVKASLSLDNIMTHDLVEDILYPKNGFLLEDYERNRNYCEHIKE